MHEPERIAGAEARFHRFEVGRIVCTAVSDGGILIQLPPRPVPGQTAPGSPAAEPPKAPPPMLVPLSCLVVQMPQSDATPPQTVLIDSGFGLTPELLGKPMRSAGRLLDSLQAAGLTPASIDVVLISHLDIDHVAGLYDAAGLQVFPNARYFASAEAVRFWSDENVDLSSYASLPWVKQERVMIAQHVLTRAGDRLHLFAAGDEVVPGIKTLSLPGHAPGQVGFVISSEGESLLYTADAITQPVVSLETPEVYNIMDLDPNEAVKTRKELIATLSGSGWLSFSPHFPWPSWGRVKQQGEKHVWNSAEGYGKGLDR